VRRRVARPARLAGSCRWAGGYAGDACAAGDRVGDAPGPVAIGGRPSACRTEDDEKDQGSSSRYSHARSPSKRHAARIIAGSAPSVPARAAICVGERRARGSLVAAAAVATSGTTGSWVRRSSPNPSRTRARSGPEPTGRMNAVCSRSKLLRRHGPLRRLVPSPRDRAC
jgi:hypothetical protein